MSTVATSGQVWLVEPGGNPFNLPMPAPWWLTLLVQYDDQLAIMPSRRECAYRLVRRVPREKRLGLQRAVLHQHPDTTAMIRFGVVPVATVPTWAVRSDKIIRDLMRADTWRVAKDATALTDQLEARERAAAARQDATLADDLLHVSGDALTSLRVRTGQRISLRDVERGRRGKTEDTDTTRATFAPASPRRIVDAGSSPLPGPRIVLATG